MMNLNNPPIPADKTPRLSLTAPTASDWPAVRRPNVLYLSRKTGRTAHDGEHGFHKSPEKG